MLYHRSTPRWTLGAVGALLLAACNPNTRVPSEAQIKCDRDAHCPGTMVCRKLVELCVDPRDDDQQGPGLSGEASLAPPRATVGTPVTVNFTADEPLGLPPQCHLFDGTQRFAFVADDPQPGAPSRLIYQPTGRETEGVSTVSLTLVDKLGNESKIDVGGVELDFSPPMLQGLRWDLPVGHTALRAASTAFSGSTSADAIIAAATVVDAEGNTVRTVTDDVVLTPDPDSAGALQLTGVVDLAPGSGLAEIADNQTLAIEVVLVDGLGNQTAELRSAFVPVDIQPPTGGTVFVQEDSPVANPNVTIVAAAVGATRVRFDGDLVGEGVWYSAAFPFTRRVTLSAADGIKTLTATFEDEAGNALGPMLATVELRLSGVDQTPPSVLTAAALTETSVTVAFSESVVAAGATDTDNFAIAPELAIFGAAIDANRQTVTLTTELQVPQQSYAVSVFNVFDAAGNALDMDANSAVFVGAGEVPDPAAPVAITPIEGAALPPTTSTSVSVPLVWTGRFGASTYTVEVATDAAFDNLVAGTPLDVSAPTTSTTVTIQSFLARDYFWRVRADSTAPGQWSEVARFGARGETIFVDCAFAPEPTDHSVGNRDRPFNSIQEAINLAAGSAAYEVRVTTCATGQVELLSLAYGVSVRGGYDSAWDTQQGKTPLPAAGVFTVLAIGIRKDFGFRAETALSGFAIEGGAGSGSFPSAALYIADADASLQIEDCDVQGGSATDGPTFAIYVNGAGKGLQGGPTIRDSTVLGGDSTSPMVRNSWGLFVNDSSQTSIERNTIIGGDVAGSGQTTAFGAELSDLTLLENTIRGGASDGPVNPSSVAVWLNDTTVEMLRNVVDGGASDGSVSGVVARAGSGLLANNLVRAGELTDSFGVATAVRLEQFATVHLVNNTLFAGVPQGANLSHTGILLTNGVAPMLTNNLIVATTTPSACIVEDGPGNDPASVHHNAFVGCTEFYVNAGDTPKGPTTPAT